MPREILWLNGAPGAGKGANTPFILKHRGLNRSVAVSSILDDNAEVRRRKDAGELIPDTVVGDVLLDCIFGPENDGIGLVVDGFPRTALQADFLKLLHDKLVDLHRAYKMTPEAPRFPRTLFKVVVLYVDEEESVRRQLHRAKEVQMHNLRVKDAGFGSLLEARTTDLDEKKARLRYSIFKHHYTTLLRLMQHFPFTLIDAMGSLKECELQIAKELRYQSSLDLDEDTYALIAHIPLAKEVVRRSRQQLVARLDWYAARNLEVFRSVLVCIDDEIIPMVKRCSLAGHAEFITANAIFHEAPVAVDMVVDVLSDRGFSVSYRPDFKVIPHKVDLKTGEIESRTEYQHRFRIEFDSERLRDHATRAEPDSESGALELIDKLGGPSPASFHYVPPSMDAEGRQRGSKGAKARALAQEAKAVGLDKEVRGGMHDGCEAQIGWHLKRVSV